MKVHHVLLVSTSQSYFTEIHGVFSKKEQFQSTGTKIDTPFHIYFHLMPSCKIKAIKGLMCR
jgi:hypothetical protein